MSLANLAIDERVGEGGRVDHLGGFFDAVGVAIVTVCGLVYVAGAGVTRRRAASPAIRIVG